MNNYVRKLFGVVFQSKQARQIVRIQLQPAPTSPDEWRKYWQAQGFLWRTEPEIDTKRQEELSRRRTIIPDIEKGIYPFKGMKLSRADVEWLLATHENGRGPVDWSDEHQRERAGLDLRGAHLQEEDLSGLPLARIYGGLAPVEWVRCTQEQREMAAVHLQEANLWEANLQEAGLGGANLHNAMLMNSDLQEAKIIGANLQEAIISANLQEANLWEANLQEAGLGGANLQKANLGRANLHNAMLIRADLQEANLGGANLRKASLIRAKLKGANLEGVTLDDEKHVGPRIADSEWSDVNLTVIKWSQVKILGDEYTAQQKRDNEGKIKEKPTRLREYEAAVRANRQLAVALQNQGLNEDAARFVYRAQVLQRKVLWRQRNFWKWLGSAILALLAGYGYRMWRILAAYLFVVLLCAGAYFVLGIYYEPHLSFLDAILISVTAFHGRVFSEPFLHPGAPQLWVTAFEAVAGLVIEGVFIAMLTQKFFGK